MTKKILFPVILLWRDRTIDAAECDRLVIPHLYIRKGRILTIKNIVDGKEFRLEVPGVMKVYGDIRIARKAREVSPDDLAYMRRTASITLQIEFMADQMRHVEIDLPAFIEHLEDERRKEYIIGTIQNFLSGNGVEAKFITILSARRIK